MKSLVALPSKQFSTAFSTTYPGCQPTRNYLKLKNPVPDGFNKSMASLYYYSGTAGFWGWWETGLESPNEKAGNFSLQKIVLADNSESQPLLLDKCHLFLSERNMWRPENFRKVFPMTCECNSCHQGIREEMLVKDTKIFFPYHRTMQSWVQLWSGQVAVRLEVTPCFPVS